MLQNWSCKFHSSCQNTLFTLTIRLLGLLHSILPEKNRLESFLHWKVCLFLKNLYFQQPLRCYRNDLVTSPSNCQKALLTLIIRPLGLVTLDTSRKITLEAFLQWKCCLFFNSLCFQQPLMCYRNDLVTSTVIVRIACWPLYFIPWDLLHSILRERFD